MNFPLFEDTIINYRMVDKSSYSYLYYHMKADTVMKWVCMCMAMVGHALCEVHQRSVLWTATCSLIMVHKELSIWYNHNYMVARILEKMLANHWQPSSPENVSSNVIHNEGKMSSCSSVLQPHTFRESSDSKLQYLCSEQPMQFVNHCQQCKITSIPSHVHGKCITCTR